MKSLLTAGLLAFTLPTPLLAQGTDECAGAQPIAGLGTFAFDQTSATQSADPSTCGSLNYDVWFEWTAPYSSIFVMENCAMAAHDTKIAVHESCGASPIACNDDACSLQSKVNFNGVAGQAYLLRIGTYGSTPGTVGSFSMSDLGVTINPTNGHAYMLFTNPGSWTACNAAASSLIYQGVAGHLVTYSNQAELFWVRDNLPNVLNYRLFIGMYQDTSAPGYSEPLGGWRWVTGEPISYTNWLGGEPNNGSGGIEHFGEQYGLGGWNDVPDLHSPTGAYIVEWDLSTSNVTFCNPANNNSTGFPSILWSENSAASPVGHRLMVQQGPPNQFGYFLVGTGMADPGVTISQGEFCLATSAGQSFGRYNVAGGALNSIGIFNGSGDFGNVVGTSATGMGYDLPSTLPLPGSPTIQAGQTWHFQLWHREDGGASNFSNGLSLNF